MGKKKKLKPLSEGERQDAKRLLEVLRDPLLGSKHDFVYYYEDLLKSIRAEQGTDAWERDARLKEIGTSSDELVDLAEGVRKRDEKRKARLGIKTADKRADDEAEKAAA